MKEIYEFKIKKLSDLSGYDSNSRTHSEEQIQQIAKSIKTFGFTNPILIDENNGIIAGHGRALAAAILNIDNVPCMVIDGLTQHDKAALVIADNKLAENAGWNYDALKSELGFLNDVDFDLSLTGFSSDELTKLLVEFNCEIDLPELPNGEKEPFQQKTFTLHDEQVVLINGALALAKNKPLVDSSLNENSNGNALTLICEQWLKENN
jgi:ParB-like chromosome segregation protein Spo0J